MLDIEKQLPLSLLLIETYVKTEQRHQAKAFVVRLKKAISSHGLSTTMKTQLSSVEDILSQA